LRTIGDTHRKIAVDTAHLVSDVRKTEDGSLDHYKMRWSLQRQNLAGRRHADEKLAS